jgi:hypothetical protein
MSSSRLDDLGSDWLTRLAARRIFLVLSKVVGIGEETIAIEVRPVHPEFDAYPRDLRRATTLDTRSTLDEAA